MFGHKELQQHRTIVNKHVDSMDQVPRPSGSSTHPYIVVLDKCSVPIRALFWVKIRRCNTGTISAELWTLFHMKIEKTSRLDAVALIPAGAHWSTPQKSRL